MWVDGCFVVDIKTCYNQIRTDFGQADSDHG